MGELGDMARAEVARLKALGFDQSAVLTQDQRDNREPGVRIGCSGCEARFNERDQGVHGPGCRRKVRP